MKITEKIVTSVTQPQQTNVLWHNPETGELKMFGNKGWEVVGEGGSGVSSFSINILWEELKELRDSAKLIPGMSYRITDYVATTSDPESRSANHPFDIIVIADDEKTLNENARAIAHEGDIYFEKCNLAAYKLKYCLDNDTNRFSWAQEEFDGYTVDFDGVLVKCELVSSNDTTYSGLQYKLTSQLKELGGSTVHLYTSSLNSLAACHIDVIYEGEIVQQIDGYPLEFSYTKIDDGKGVIYHMTDEHNNSAPFDFKGIQIAVYYGIIRGSSNSVYTTDGKHNKFESLEFQGYSYLFTQNSDSNRADNSVEELYGFAKNNKFGCDEEGTLLHAVCCTKESPVENCCNLLGNYWYADHLCYKFILFEENKGWTSDSDFIAEKKFVDVYNSGYNKYLGNCYSLNCMCSNSIMLGSIRGESESCLQIQASSSLIYQSNNTILTKKFSDLLS